MYGNVEPHLCTFLSLSLALTVYPNDKNGHTEQEVSLLPPEDPAVRFQIWLRKSRRPYQKPLEQQKTSAAQRTPQREDEALI